MRTLRGLLLMAMTLAAVAGCHEVNYTAAERYEEGLVVCLSGAGGMMGECDRIRDGLDSGGVNRAIEVFAWSRGEVLTDQTAVEENHRLAAQLAQRVESYLLEHPGRPVHLIGVSAGTGLAVWAAENLPDDKPITGIILLASSLDTKYDLSKALGKLTDHLYSFNSLADTILSLGVTMTGTVDRGGGLAGGLVGFSPPDSASDEAKALYKQKLTQIRWWPGDAVLGHLGDHLGATNPTFVRVRIAPLVLGKEPVAAAADAARAKAEARSQASARKDAGPDREVTARPERAGKAPAAGNDRKGRFIEWKVVDTAPQGPPEARVSEETSARPGKPAAKTAAPPGPVEPIPPIEEAQFLRGPRRLP